MEYMTSKELVSEVYNHQEEARDNPDKYRPIPTTIPDLNYLIGGFGERYFVVVGAAPKVGKSVTLIAQAMDMAQKHPDKQILFMSYEMWTNQLGAAVLANRAGVDRKKFRDFSLLHGDWQEVKRARDVISTFNIYWAFTQNTIKGIGELILTIEKETKKRIDIVIIDYVQLMQGPGGTRVEQHQRISRGLKLMTRRPDHPLCVIAASQLSNEAIKNNRYDHTAYLYGALDRDCDIGLVITPFKNVLEEPIPNKRNIQVVVAREGEPGIVQAGFIGKFARVAGAVKDDIKQGGFNVK